MNYMNLVITEQGKLEDVAPEYKPASKIPIIVLSIALLIMIFR